MYSHIKLSKSLFIMYIHTCIKQEIFCLFQIILENKVRKKYIKL